VCFLSLVLSPGAEKAGGWFFFPQRRRLPWKKMRVIHPSLPFPAAPALEETRYSGSFRVALYIVDERLSLSPIRAPWKVRAGLLAF